MKCCENSTAMLRSPQIPATHQETHVSANMFAPKAPSAHGAMTALLGGPGVGNFWQKMMKPAGPPAPGAVPPTPTLGNSQDALDEAARQQQMGIQRGLTSTMLTGGSGLSNMGSTSKTLLGG